MKTCMVKLFRLLLVLLFLSLSSPVFIYSADIKAEPISSDDMTSPPLPGLPSATRPTLNLPGLETAWAQLKAELIEQGLDSETLLKQLIESQIEVKESRLLLVELTARCVSLESSKKTERMGAEAAIRVALEREALAIREASFWQFVGITGIVVGGGTLLFTVGPAVVSWVLLFFVN